jgi:uncharacterized protein YidB (DUF937 family)
MSRKKGKATSAGHGNVETADMDKLFAAEPLAADKPLLELPLPEQRRLACAVLDWMHENIGKGELAGLKDKFCRAGMEKEFDALVERQSPRGVDLTMDQAGSVLDDSDRAALLKKSGFENKSSLHYTLKTVFPALIKELTPGFRTPSSQSALEASILTIRQQLKPEMLL